MKRKKKEYLDDENFIQELESKLKSKDLTVNKTSFLKMERLTSY